MFNTMMDGIKEESVGSLFNLQVQVQVDPIVAEGDDGEAGPAPSRRRPPRPSPPPRPGPAAPLVPGARPGTAPRAGRGSSRPARGARSARSSPRPGRPRTTPRTCPPPWPRRAWPGRAAPGSSATPRPARTGRVPPRSGATGRRTRTSPGSAATRPARAAPARSSRSATGIRATGNLRPPRWRCTPSRDGASAGPLQPDRDGPGARADAEDDGHLDHVPARLRRQHPPHHRPLPGPQQRAKLAMRRRACPVVQAATCRGGRDPARASASAWANRHGHSPSRPPGAGTAGGPGGPGTAVISAPPAARRPGTRRPGTRCRGSGVRRLVVIGRAGQREQQPGRPGRDGRQHVRARVAG